MSIALDLNLYIRDKNIKLSLDLQGFLYTMAFYVGSNAKAWVSQNELADHLGVNERTIRRYIAKSKKSLLLIVRKNPRDKNKNIYQFAPNLVNYHRSRFMDKSRSDKKRRTDVTHEKVNHRTDATYAIGQPCPMLDDKKSSQTCATSSIEHIENPPKGTRKATLKAKEQGSPPPASSFLNPESMTFEEQEIEIAKNKGVDINHCFSKFIERVKKRQGNEQFNRSDWKKWLEKERPSKSAVPPAINAQKEKQDYTKCSACQRPSLHCECRRAEDPPINRDLIRKTIADARIGISKGMNRSH